MHSIIHQPAMMVSPTPHSVCRQWIETIISTVYVKHHNMNNIWNKLINQVNLVHKLD